MSTPYNYQRAMANNAWDINNLAIVDINGNVIPIGDVVKAAFPTHGMVEVACDMGLAVISLESALDAAEQLVLDALVANYKNGIII